MNSRSGIAFAVAGLLFAQGASAAPVAGLQPLDPLVALSVLGSDQSRAAVIAGGATAGMAAAATTAQAAPPPPPGWPANQYPPTHYQQQAGAWAYIPFLIAIIAILALHLSDDDDRDLVPISP